MKLILHPNPATKELVDADDVFDDLAVCVQEADGDLALDEIVMHLRLSEAQLWTVHGEDGDHLGTVVTEGQRRPGGSWLNIVAIRIRYNDQDAFAFALKELKSRADEVGSKLCGESRRPGMEKHLEKLGWKRRFAQYVAP